MALPFLLLLIATAWGLGALQLWPRAGRVRDLSMWLGGALALGVAACVAWGFAGVLRQGDWQALTNAQAAHRLFGPGTRWFGSTGWPLLDRAANVYLSLDLILTLVALCAASLHGFVFWAGVAERRRQARVRRER